MRLTIPVSPDTVPHLPALLKILSSNHAGEGHQLYILAAAQCLSEAEKFATDARLKTKFAGVVMTSVSMSQMTHQHNFLWVTYFRNPHPDTLWLDPGATIVGGHGWLDRIEDSLQFATSFFLGPQMLHTTGVYRAGASKRLRAWECPCFRATSNHVHLSHASPLSQVYRASSLFHTADSLADLPPLVEVVVPRTWGRSLPPAPCTPPKTKEVVKVTSPEPAPEVTPEPAPEVVEVDTEPKTEVNVVAPPRVVRRAKS